ncbi:MAG: ATP-dependent protease ATPase subunit HslU [Planctomycetota bacterium]
MRDLTPRRIVAELDRYIVGQDKAKRAVAIAIRNRWRRQQLGPEIRQDVMPKNIIMIGPTGVGKTEITRRLAGLVQAPFVKVEASRYTEVGYHGRDVESMIRDLAEAAHNMVMIEEREGLLDKAREQAEDEILEALLPPVDLDGVIDSQEHARRMASHRKTKEKIREKLRAGQLDDREVEISTEEKAIPTVEVISNQGVEQMGVDFQNMFERLVPSQTVRRKIKVAEARELLTQKAAENMTDREKVRREAVRRVEETGIVFLDEIDKVATPTKKESGGPDVSREGVQRDLLPVVEGTTVLTRYGMVRSDHVLFIAAGAFHNARPSDLVPELQGRFPIRVELGDLGKAEFLRILTEPQNALTRQYEELLNTEGVHVRFEPAALEEIADVAVQANRRMQNIGARRLHTVLETLMEEISFDAPEMSGNTVTVDAELVRDRLSGIIEDEDLSRYIL